MDNGRKMKYRTLKWEEEVKKGDLVRCDEYDWTDADGLIGETIGNQEGWEAKRPISIRIRKSLEFRTLKRVCFYENPAGADCGKNVLQDNKCSAKNCPIWARLPEVK